MCDVDEGGLPVCIKKSALYSQLAYWTQRCAMASGAERPFGLYDAAVYERMLGWQAGAVARGVSEKRQRVVMRTSSGLRSLSQQRTR